jgi:hypothetical protein
MMAAIRSHRAPLRRHPSDSPSACDPQCLMEPVRAATYKTRMAELMPRRARGQTVFAALALSLSLAPASAFQPVPCGAFTGAARVPSGAARPGRVTVCMAAGAGNEEAPAMNMAKRNALAANRLQWGISGVPAKTGPAVAAEQAAAAAPGEDEGRLGAELAELVRQARAKAAGRAGTGGDSEVAAAGAAATTQRLGLPGFQLESFGFKGRWEQAGLSFMLYPPSGVAPKAVVHFLGGAFVGAAPHISYRYMLEDIADNGYIVVTTPYNLIFNYVTLCANVVQDSRAAMSRVPAGLPTIGVGHSCGSLLHTLLPVLYPEESPRIANVLVSWNNRPAAEAIPQFEEVVIPFVNALLDTNDASTLLRDTVRRGLEQADETAREMAKSPLAPLAVQTELLPLTKEGLKIVEQIPGLLEMVHEGEREFLPTVDRVAELLRACYPVPASLVVSFNDDSLDESDKVPPDARTRALSDVPVCELLQRSERGTSVSPARLAQVEGTLRVSGGAESAAAVDRVRLQGTHVTPCTQVDLVW